MYPSYLPLTTHSYRIRSFVVVQEWPRIDGVRSLMAYSKLTDKLMLGTVSVIRVLAYVAMVMLTYPSAKRIERPAIASFLCSEIRYPLKLSVV